MIEKIVITVISLIVGSLLTYFRPKIIRGFRKFTPGRRKIKKIIEKVINDELRSVFKETWGLHVLKYGIKLEWDEKVDESTYLTEEGDIVIKLSYAIDKNQSRSFTKALMLYLEESFMPGAEPFIGGEIYKGCKHTIAKEVTLEKDRECYRHFLSDYLSPLCVDHSFEQLMNKLELMSQRGFFRSVLLRELYFLYESGILPKAEMREEVKSFIKFLWNIANKEEYEREHKLKPELSFIKRYIKITIVLVKRKEIDDLSSHVEAGEIAFDQGAQKVYVTGWGEFNIKSTKEVAERLATRGVNLRNELRFNAELSEGVQPGICFVLER